MDLSQPWSSTLQSTASMLHGGESLVYYKQQKQPRLLQTIDKTGYFNRKG